MKRTDYSEIAPKYDQNTVRLQIPRDELLGARIAAEKRRPFAVLDLACGTGNYLEAQTRAFAGEDVAWHGIDASEAMLGIAREKVAGVDLRHGRAEELPYESGSFDYVVTSFAFHHFENKPRAMDEIRRVLRPGGAFRMRNIAPTHMRGWWVYRFFPLAAFEDEKRFWAPEHLFSELSSRGFSVEICIDVRLARVPWTEVLADAERRDISELHLVSDADHEAGLARIRQAIARDPDGGTPSELALLDATALRPA